MNNFTFNPQNLYNALMELCAPDDSPFYYVDHRLGDNHYRVFTYRLGQYSDFVKPYARECRGHMFHIRPSGDFVRLAAAPPPKFFNLNENPFTMDLDMAAGAQLIMDKVDGSLISSFIDNPAKLRLKSKTALESEQAVAAMAYLATNKPLYDFVELMTGNDWTVNMEFTSPQYLIVVPHQKDNLTVLSVRSTKNGAYMGYEIVKQLMTHWLCEKHLVHNYADQFSDLKAFLDSVPEMSGQMEGYVVALNNGETFKIKTNAYVSLHRMKDSMGSPKRLFEVVVNEAHDDAKAAFAGDEWVLTQIAAMEVKVAKIYQDLKAGPIHFHNHNKELDRKSFAIKGQADLPKMYFGIAMSLYLDKEVNYKEWLLKHYKEFGITDEEQVAE